MEKKGKVSTEHKVEVVQRYLAGELNQEQAARIADVHKSSYQGWVAQYETEGTLGLMNVERNRAYREETTLQAVEAVMD